MRTTIITDKEKNIIEGNVLMGTFMGWNNNKSFYTPFEDASFCNGEPTHICDKQSLKFHKDWNWLMLAVEKVEKTNTPNKHCNDFPYISFSIHKGKYRFEIDASDRYNGKAFYCETENLMDSIWLCIVEYIQWYNSNFIQI